MKLLLAFILLTAGMTVLSGGNISWRVPTLLMNLLIAALLVAINQWRPVWTERGRLRVQPFLIATGCIVAALVYVMTILVVR